MMRVTEYSSKVIFRLRSLSRPVRYMLGDNAPCSSNPDAAREGRGSEPMTNGLPFFFLGASIIVQLLVLQMSADVCMPPQPAKPA